MSTNFRTKLGERVHVRELVTGSRFSGQLQCKRNKVAKVIFHSFDDHIHIDASNPVYLQTEHLEVVSLHNNISGNTGKTSSVRGNTQSYRQELFSNIVIVGYEKWTKEDNIRRLSFSVPEAFDILRNRERIARLNLNQDRSEDDWCVLDRRCRGKRIRLFYTGEYHWGFDEPRNLEPRFIVEFEEPIPLTEYDKAVIELTSFLSFVLGFRVAPEKFTISKLSLEEFQQSLEDGNPIEDFSLLSSWKQDNDEKFGTGLHSAPVVSFDDEELEALGDTLTTWIDRSTDWFEACVVMSGCLSLRGEISGDRLLAATRWFERIPNTNGERINSKRDLAVVTETAFRAVKEAELDIEKHRLAGALGRLALESREKQFQRLIAFAWQGKRLPKPLDEYTKHLCSAFVYRGKAAHGLFFPQGDAFDDLTKAVLALEALCFMLTVKELPISKKGRSRMMEHRLVADYWRFN